MLITIIDDGIFSLPLPIVDNPNFVLVTIIGGEKSFWLISKKIFIIYHDYS